MFMSYSSKFYKCIESVMQYAIKNGNESEVQFIPLGIIGFISFGLYYVIWHDIEITAYENMPLRIVAMILCLGLILKNYWPEKIRSFLPIYWYLTLLYIMPFFFTFMLLKNNFSDVWVLNSMTALFYLILLMDLASFFVILTLGVIVGWLCFICTSGVIKDHQNLGGVLFAYLSVLSIGEFLSYNRQQINKEKANMMAMVTFSNSIAHELRTPLATINLSASSVKDYLNDLTEAYEAARNAKLQVKEIRASQFDALQSALKGIEAETKYANTIISMLLVSSEQSKIKKENFKSISISHCVEEALKRYPFLSGETELVHWKNDMDFEFKGSEVLTIHVLFNLLKNAIYYIKAAGKGNIHIWLERSAHTNKLYFKETGQGIPEHNLSRIFDRFFTTTYHGSGIGLAFCKAVMQAYEGGISCTSQEGEYTEFMLTFPPVIE